MQLLSSSSFRSSCILLHFYPEVYQYACKKQKHKIVLIIPLISFVFSWDSGINLQSFIIAVFTSSSFLCLSLVITGIDICLSVFLSWSQLCPIKLMSVWSISHNTLVSQQNFNIFCLTPRVDLIHHSGRQDFCH